MGYGPRTVSPTEETAEFEEWVDAVMERSVGVFDLSVRTGEGLYDGCSAIEGGSLDLYAVFDWDPCDGRPGSGPYRRLADAISDAAGVPESFRWNGEEYDASLSVGCHTESDDTPDGHHFAVGKYRPPVKQAHPVPGPTLLGWYRDLLGIEAATIGGVEVSGGLLWWSDLATGGYGGSVECDVCSEPIVTGRYCEDGGAVQGYRDGPSADADPVVTACLHCAAREAGLGFHDHEAVTPPGERREWEGAWDTEWTSSAQYELREEHRKQVRGE